jgi:membrane protease YdiL (CAAX protease family)
LAFSHDLAYRAAEAKVTLRLADSLLKASEWLSAAEEYRRLLVLRPDYRDPGKVYFFVGYCEMRSGNYAAAESAFTRGAAARDSTVANISRDWLSCIQGYSWVYLEMFRLFQERPRAYFVFGQLYTWSLRLAFPVLLLLLIKRKRSIPESIVDVKWGPTQVIVLLVLIAVTTLTAELIRALSPNGILADRQDYSQVSTWALSPLFWELAALCLSIFFFLFYKTSPVRLRLVQREGRRNLERVLWTFFGVCIIGIYVSTSIPARSVRNVESSTIFNLLRMQRASPAVWLLMWLFTVVLAPVSQEMLFRGVFYASLRKTLSPVLAGAACSVVFAAFHLNLAPAYFLSIFVMSMGFCLLYEYSGYLWSPIVAHGLVNGILLRWVFAEGGLPRFL